LQIAAAAAVVVPAMNSRLFIPASKYFYVRA
jgi:hypothetical protein